MITKELKEAAKEINEIFVYLPKEYIERVPIKLREFIRAIEDNNHVTKINPKKRLEEQDIMDKTKTLLTIIHKDYWCTPEEKVEIEKILKENDKEFEKILKEQYSREKLFNKKKKQEYEGKVYLIEKPKKNIFTKILDLIKKLVKK